MSYILLYSGVGVASAVTVNSSNAIIQIRQTPTASSNAAILNESFLTPGSNAVIVLETLKTIASNAIIQNHVTTSVSTNAKIETNQTTIVNATVALTSTKTPHSNAIVQGGQKVSLSTNAVIKGTQIKQTVTNAIIFVPTVVASENAVVAKVSTVASNSNAVIQGTLEKTLSTDAIIAISHSWLLSTDAIIKARPTLPISSNAVIASSIITRSAISDITMFAEYLRIIGILMLVDPSFQTELNTVPSQQTFTFVKKVVKGLFYVDIGGGGVTLTGQVRTGDGIAYSSQVNVAVRVLGDTITGATVITGTALAGNGTKELWIQTLADGSFELSLAGTGVALVEMTPKQGVVMSQDLTI